MLRPGIFIISFSINLCHSHSIACTIHSFQKSNSPSITAYFQIFFSMFSAYDACLLRGLRNTCASSKFNLNVPFPHLISSLIPIPHQTLPSSMFFLALCIYTSFSILIKVLTILHCFPTHWKQHKAQSHILFAFI